MVRKIGFLIVVSIVVLGFVFQDMLSYGWMQAKGQINILRNVVEINDILIDPSYPDSLKQKIRLIQEIKQFGIDSLGLTPSENYTTFYDQEGKKLMWLLSASERYKVKAYRWRFPIIGEFPYKGFFDSTRAVTEERKLIAQGFDTHMGEAAAWSLLGYIREPILSSMLNRSEGRLANLVLHEMTHGTLFVKDNLELNENLASFVGDWGAIRFLNQKYGPDSEKLTRYEFQKKYQDSWSQHMLRGAVQLDSLYDSFTASELSTAKDRMKTDMLRNILINADTLLGGKYPLTIQDKNSGIAANNAYFINYKTYKSQQNQFLEEFITKFDRDFPSYMAFLKEKYQSN